MKKLNITKEQFNRSRYFQRKYGKLEYVSESGKLFKTNKGKVLKFNEGLYQPHKREDPDLDIPVTEQEKLLCDYIANEIEEKFSDLEVNCSCNWQNPGEEMHIEIDVGFPEDTDTSDPKYDSLCDDLEKLVDAIGAQENEGERWGDSSFTWNNDEMIFGEVWPIDSQVDESSQFNEGSFQVLDSDGETTTLSRECPFCHREHHITIDIGEDEFYDRYDAMRAGELIQNAFPMLDPNQREFIKTGICDKCWDSL